MIIHERERLTWMDLQRQCAYIAGQIIDKMPNKIGLISIARGGNVPATVLSQLTGLPIRKYVTIKSYQGTSQGCATIEPFNISGTDIVECIFIEDIIDTGNSLLELHRQLGLNSGEKIDVVAMVAKPIGLKNTLGVINLPTKAGTRMVAQDVWVDFPWEPTLKQPQSKGSKHGT